MWKGINLFKHKCKQSAKSCALSSGDCVFFQQILWILIVSISRKIFDRGRGFQRENETWVISNLWWRSLENSVVINLHNCRHVWWFHEIAMWSLKGLLCIRIFFSAMKASWSSQFNTDTIVWRFESSCLFLYEFQKAAVVFTGSEWQIMVIFCRINHLDWMHYFSCLVTP